MKRREEGLFFIAPFFSVGEKQIGRMVRVRVLLLEG